MKVGINLSLWTARPDADEHAPILRHLAPWGYDGVEFHVAMLSLDEVKAMGDAAAAAGLACVPSLVLPASIADPVSDDPGLRRAAVEAIKLGVDKARAVGSDTLVGPLFQGLGRETGQPPTPEEWRRAIEVIREAGLYAAEHGVRIALEPLNRFEMYMVNTAADGVRFCDEVGLANVGLLLDTHHANIEEDDVPRAWTAAAPRLFYVHISENHRGTPGSGHAAPPEVFRALRGTGINYDGWITIEAPGVNVSQLVTRMKLWRKVYEREEDVAVQGLAYIRNQWQLAADSATQEI